jgi:D-lyxose ketol-isomerase
MKRSEIDSAIQEMLDFLAGCRFFLPPWAKLLPKQWTRIGLEADEIRRHRLGWDVTDFGSGNFAKIGLTLFTLRNGLPALSGSAPGAKDYCEKVMLARENQETPYHYHYTKMEDLINRGGGRLVIRLYNSTEDEKLDEQRDVGVQVDGFTKTMPAGSELILEPGESVTLVPNLYHSFWAMPGGGHVLVGEVSRVNDDTRDNRFLEALPRYPAIEEDAPAHFVLCHEYPPAR